MAEAPAPVVSGLDLNSFIKFESYIGSDRTSLGTQWEMWLKIFETYMNAQFVKNPAQLRSCLLHCIGTSFLQEFFVLNNTGADDDYVQAKNALTAHFKPTNSPDYEETIFLDMTPLKGESIDQYQVRLRAQAEKCDFGDTIDRRIKVQIYRSFKDRKLLEDGMKETLTLQQVLEKARANALAKQRSGEIQKKQPSEAKTVNKVTKYKQSNRQSSQKTSKCYNCGGTYPHDGGNKSCPAYGKDCNLCKKSNHFAKYCKSGKGSNGKTHKGRPKSKTVHEVQGCQSDDEDDYLFAITLDEQYENSEQFHVNAVTNIVLQPPKFAVEIDGRSLDMVADTAASVSIIDEETFKSSGLAKKVKLNQSGQKLSPYGGGKIMPKGKFRGKVKHGKHIVHETFYVVPGKSGNLLGIQASQELKLIEVKKPVNCVNSISDTHVCKSKDELMANHPNLCQGVGKLKNFDVKLHIDETVAPVAKRHKRVPFHQRKLVEAELKRLQDADIIEPVEGPTPWVSQLVVVEKPNKPGEIRLCVDMRSANKAIKRERHPMPTVEDLQFIFNGCTVFSRFDLISGYHQLELAKESRYITTFSTHVGLFRYKRLNFGISCASEIFQNAIAGVISKFVRCINISDDILVGGVGDSDHDQRVEEIATHLEKNGLTVRIEKCDIKQAKLEYYGLNFSAEGMEPSPKRMEALVQMSEPSSSTEVQSLLGMTNFSARFIRNYSSITEPLRRLTRQDAEFEWGPDQRHAFKTLVDKLSGKPVLAFFDIKLKTEILVDASPVGLGGILVQYEKPDEPKVIAYGSRSLTPTEQRYWQIEREALAVVWACEYFHNYVYGCPITVVTDHMPLVKLLGSPTAKLSARLERWALRLQPYEVTVRYQPGVKNPADYLSRHPLESTKTSSRHQKVAEEYVNMISTHAVPKAMSRQEIISATNDDVTLTTVKSLLESGRWYVIDKPEQLDSEVNVQDLKLYKKVRHELCTTQDGLVLRGNRIVMPESLQLQTVDLAHEGHQGIVKTKALLREKVWFPGVDKMVQDKIERCIPCKAVYDPKQREPLQMTETPERPWSHLTGDFYGPLPSGHYLLGIMCERTRFPEVEVLGSTAAKTVIPALDRLFSSRGIPDKLKTDNGPPFNSHEFSVFAEVMGFKHQKVTPAWPEANGGSESFMKTLGRVCKKAQVAGLPWRRELQKFLRNYRATPHSSTNIPPATALNGYSLKTKLPEPVSQKPTQVAELDENDRTAKAKMKMYAEKRRNIRKSDIKVGDTVLIKNPLKYGKLEPKFQAEPFEVIDKRGSMVLAQRGQEVKARNSSHFRPVKTDDQPLIADYPEEITSSDPVNSQEPVVVNLDVPASPIAVPGPSASVRSPPNVSMSSPVRNALSNETPSQSVGNASQQSRPRRETRMPAKFNDYVVKMPNMASN